VSLVFPSTHPLVLDKVAQLRAAETRPREFRGLVRALAALLGQEATADLVTRPIAIETPLGTAEGQTIADVVGIIPILRAGLGMAEGLLELLPEAEVWHIGLYRDETTLLPTEYYHKVPMHPRISLGLIVDPMLATGGSAVRACEILKEAGVKRLKLITLIAAHVGIERMTAAMPDVPIHVAAIDSHLTEFGFIYPGLGDAGDRQFGTSPLEND
jgi:uracil phosphoribosyltransferase